MSRAPELRATFEHMIFSAEVWNAALGGEWAGNENGDTSVPGLLDRHERSAAAFAALARELNDEQRLEDTFRDPWAETPIERTVGTTIVHVILHNAQHRTEARHFLERLGVPDLPEGDPKEWEQEAHPGWLA